MADPPKMSRYPGIRSFEREEEHLFFGRAKEALDLFSAVKVKPLTVLFSKSGIGKTSLINAGLIPLLEADYFEPVKIRLQDTSTAPVETVKKVLKPYLDQKNLKQFAGNKPTLWEYLRSCRFSKNGQAFVPVLIFDQFEEFFNHPEQTQLDLNLALADLVNQRLPDQVQQQFRNIPRKERTEADLDWYSPLDIRIVLAIRSDKMSALDDMKHYIPTILHDRFHLRPLQADTARMAIIAPAAIENEAFQTKPFQYEEDAVQTMLNTLSNEQGEIESFQLQLLCQYIEDKVQSDGKDNNSVVGNQIFGGRVGIQSVLNDYYEREIEKLPPEDQTTARRFIEEGLIVDERRVGLGAGMEQTSFGVSEKLLNRLLESRLIRAEQIHLGKIYELSHDTLVDPILKSYEKRRLAEERLEAQRKLEAEQLRLQEANRKKTQARLLALLGFVLFFVALLAGIFAYRNYLKSEAAKIAAEKSESQASAAKLAAQSWNAYRTDHTLALRLAEAALKQDSTNDEVLRTIDQIINLPSTTYYSSVLKGHVFEVTDLAVFPDGKKVITSSFDTDMIIWDFSGLELLKIPGKKFIFDAEGHNSSTTSVAVSPDGTLILSGGADDLAKLWTSEGELLMDFSGHSSYVNDVAFSPNGQLVLTGSRDKTAMLWNLQGEVLQTFSGHQGDISSVGFTPDGQKIATASNDGSVKLWSLNGTQLSHFQIGDFNLLSIAISSDGQHLLVGASNGKAYLYTISGQLKATLEGHKAEVATVAFSPDGALLATGSWDNTTKLWTLDGNEVKHLIGHNEKVSALGFSPDGGYIFTGGFDYLAKCWDLELNLFDHYNPWHTSSITTLDIAQDNQHILTGSRDNAIKLWDLSGKLIQAFEGHQNRVLSVSFSPDGRNVLSSSLDGTAIIWDMDGTPKHILDDYESAVNFATYSLDGQWIATADGRSQTVTLWSNDGVQQKRWKAGSSSIAHVQFSKDGEKLLSCGYDGFIRLWDRAGNLLDSIDNQETPVYMALFDPQENGIWSVGQELPVKHWVGNELNQKLFGSFDETYSIAFHPNNRVLVTSCWDQTAKIWNIDGELLQSLDHPDGVYAARYFPNGEYLATGCRDNFVRIWDGKGNLINALGYNVDQDQFLNNASIATINQIPALKNYGISSELIRLLLDRSVPELVRDGNNLISLATKFPGRYEAGLNNFDEAISLFQEAALKQEKNSSTIDLPVIIANAYVDRTFHLLTHQYYEAALESAQTGLTYQTIDFLQIFEIISLILTDQYQKALTKVELLKDQPTPENEYYSNFKEAFEGEIDYYRNDYGIDHPDFDRFLQFLSE